ncbi:single myb histone 5 isoform X1 [Elaeis guineensis]|uniref:Single myb histone 5 isoform X1 n=1 Tax=Elaeis guineensis var. tenera TaxID=51953 RepID=A0A6I9QAK0_ELAGV|nr:single myb histone 5 isoform X1 [Elaeis guineensis]XP_029117063.1 single myb histone 5 isoform X1 [Elaeis guineensis]XP_029117064.1 single myb histone 5 isoform X1 [Elaeis guineensis]
MGAPKQKWTAEEEAALKAGVVKHGAGKWRTILKDPEFSGVLCLRSNVDLKDKWRNISVTASGWGSREKARIALKKSKQVSNHDHNPMALSTIVKDVNDEIVNAKPLAVSSESLRIAGPKGSNSRLENLILEAITTLEEPTGSNKTSIAMYIEDQYWPPPDFKRLLSAKLKALTASGTLIKVKRKYRIAPSSSFSVGKSSNLSLRDGKHRECSRLEKDDIKPLTKSQVDAELARMRNMTAQEAAAAAAQAVAEAEAAMAEAEKAAREAEAAEADAEAAQAFAEAAMLMLKNRNAAKMFLRDTLGRILLHKDMYWSCIGTSTLSVQVNVKWIGQLFPQGSRTYTTSMMI